MIPARLRLLIAPLGLVAALAGPADAGAQDTAPTLREGDSWWFVQRDGFTGIELESSRQQVTAVLADGYRLETSRPDGGVTQELTTDLNIRQTIDGVAGDTAQFRFPLALGLRWKARSAYRNRQNGVAGVYELEREVVSSETRKTPAGEFQTWKIVSVGEWILKSDPTKVAVTDFRGRYETTCWFAPAAKTCVALEWRAYAKGHVGGWYRRELTRLELH